MGEFGFITADGVYHVTVYATDADGHFKVISMKNLRKMPTNTKNVVQQTTRSPIPTAAKYEFNLLKLTTPKPFDLTTAKPSDIASCSSCSIPEIINSTTNLEEIGLPQKLLKPVTTTNSDVINNKPINQFNNPINSNEPPKQDSYEMKNKQNMFQNSDVPNQYSPMPPKDSVQPILQLEQLSYQKIPDLAPVNTETNLLQLNEDNNLSPKPQQNLQNLPNLPDLQNHSNLQNLQNIPNQTINNKNNGDSLLTGLLYKFNYDVGYHGHREQGDRNGNKEGSYYSFGRDGYKRTVNYKANEFGYQPNVKLELVGPEDIPREENEKEKGLRNYEFKWFYLK